MAISDINENYPVEGVDQPSQGFRDNFGHIKTELTNLQNTKQESLESGVNIKTINGATLLGSGDLVVAGSGSGANLTTTLAPTQVTINSDTGTDAVIPATDGTNAGAFLPAEKTKLIGIATGATANSTDAQLRDRSTHTGTQTASTISDFAATVRATALTGLSTATNAVITATDTVLAAFGKLQAQVSSKANLAGGNTFTGSQKVSITTLTYGATVTPNFADNNLFTLTASGNFTLANPANQVAGQGGSIFIVQDATGSRLISYGANWHFEGGTEPALTTTANAVDRLDYLVRANGSIHARLAKDVK